MSDDLDDLLRRAMKTLDGQEPPGYFEALTQQTMMRLEESSMHTDDPRSELGPAEAGGADAGDSIRAVAARDEDSGLHDIRSLASSQRLRLSQRSSERSIRTDEDLLSAASGSWKAVALPEPAKMIAIAPIDDEPADDEDDAVEAAAPAQPAAKAKANAKTEAAHAEPKAAKRTAKPAVEAAAAAPAITPLGGAKQKKSPIVAIAGVGVLAAAGALIYVVTRKEPAPPAPPPVASAPTREIVSTPVASPAPPPVEVKKEEPAVVPPPPPEPEKVAAVEPEKPKAKAKVEDIKKEDKKPKGTGQVVPDVVEEPKTETAKKEPAKKAEPAADPDFDKLLKEAGVSDKKEEEKPKLEKKSLSGDDIKTAMNAVAAKVQACYTDTQGTAAVRLTVAPSGQIQNLTVTGAFAGTPTASCVESAVRSAAFPPWDGGPQSVTYSYLLSE